jgi:ceramide glucosyltransferase
MQTSVVAGVEATGLGGHLESAFLNTFFARNVTTLAALGHPCVIGKAMMFRKSILERIGGLRELKNHIAEDYAAGRKLHLLGFKVQVSRDPIRQHIGRYSFKDFWSRHIRWGRLRKMQSPAAFGVEPFFSSVLSGALGATAFALKWHVSPAHFLALHFATWAAFDAIMVTRVGEFSGLAFFPVWFVRELTHIPLWIHILMGNTVIWRGQSIRLKREELLQASYYPISDLSEFFRKPRIFKEAA